MLAKVLFFLLIGFLTGCATNSRSTKPLAATVESRLAAADDGEFPESGSLFLELKAQGTAAAVESGTGREDEAPRAQEPGVMLYVYMALAALLTANLFVLLRRRRSRH